jgi:hypothetical protein
MNYVLSASLDSRFSTLHFHCIGPLKIALRGCGFAGDKLKHGMGEELRRFSREFCGSGVQRFTQRLLKSVLLMKEASWKNKLKLIKNVFVICVNLIINAIVVPKNYFCTTSCATEMLSLQYVSPVEGFEHP